MTMAVISGNGDLPDWRVIYTIQPHISLSGGWRTEMCCGTLPYWCFIVLLTSTYWSAILKGVSLIRIVQAKLQGFTPRSLVASGRLWPWNSIVVISNRRCAVLSGTKSCVCFVNVKWQWAPPISINEDGLFFLIQQTTHVWSGALVLTPTAAMI